MRFVLGIMLLAALHCGNSTALGQSPVEAPNIIVLTEARQIVQQMIDNPRGPYSRIRWFCNDGSVLPPQAYACREHDGGRQHAEYSAERARLAELGWSVGTIFSALPFTAISRDEDRRDRLRELPLEAYMVAIDDGWVLREARGYRGRVQVEDEEVAGRELLLGLFGDAHWTSENFLLAREVTRVIPHSGAAEDLAREVRRDAIVVADLDASFQSLRAEIHGSPDATTARRVRDWAALRSGDTTALAIMIAESLEQIYGAGGRQRRLADYARRFAGNPQTSIVAAQLETESTQPKDRLRRLAAAGSKARNVIGDSNTTARTRLELFDFITELEAEIYLTANEALNFENLTRRELISLAADLIDAGFGTGLLSSRERDALLANARAFLTQENVPIDAFAELVETLRRAPQWSAGNIRYAFAAPLVRYSALDARAARFTDDVLRSSTLVGLGEITRRLASDLASLTGVSQLLNGRTGLSAFGLNPGIAQGTLRIHVELESVGDTQFEQSDIVVVPETTAELSPVAGIVTLGEGNPLSHVQLLARNFGIPNIAIAPDVLDVLAPLEQTRVVAAVATNGSLALLPYDSVPSELRDLLIPANLRGAELTVPPVDPGPIQPIRLASLRETLSGVVVGPKAANLGELAHLFPGRVAAALAIPFGIFAAHIDPDGESLKARLVNAYTLRRDDLIDAAELAILLAEIRSEIAAIRIQPEHRENIKAAMQAEFGAPDTYGVFVRSDTNVEDLPEFTGAGLSETLPNVTNTDAIIDSIPRVWASVLSPRAIAWRSSLLTNPEEVYASVLLMRSVPSEKSGVMVTTNVAGTTPGVTVSTAWGVGGGVGGEATETLVFHPDGSETLVSEAKAAYRRQLNPAGGLTLVPARDGAVLNDRDKTALRRLAQEVAARYTPVLDANRRPRPWDIEFGFVDGELTLFQIRPLVERGPQLADRIVAALVPQPPEDRATSISLDVAPKP
jgi:hypothetical protein